MSWLNNNFPNDKKMLIKKKKINTIENEHSALDLIKKSIENPSIRHDKRLKELEDGFKINLDFDLIESKISMGQGDIDLLVCHEKTLIVIELKCGKTNIRSEFTTFNGKKDKYFKFLTNDFEKTDRGKELNFKEKTLINCSSFCCQLLSQEKLVDLRKDYIKRHTNY